MYLTVLFLYRSILLVNIYDFSMEFLHVLLSNLYTYVPRKFYKYKHLLLLYHFNHSSGIDLIKQKLISFPLMNQKIKQIRKTNSFTINRTKF